MYGKTIELKTYIKSNKSSKIFPNLSEMTWVLSPFDLAFISIQVTKYSGKAAKLTWVSEGGPLP